MNSIAKRTNIGILALLALFMSIAIIPSINALPPPPPQLMISPLSAKLNVGQSQTFIVSAIGQDQNNNKVPIPGFKIDFTSSNTSVGTVAPSSKFTDSNGNASVKFTALGKGNALIIVTNTTTGSGINATVTVINTWPPRSITNLNNKSYAQKYIKWTWRDPTDYDFSRVMVYLDGKFKTNISKGVQYYNATGLLPYTVHTISTHTVDTSGNINKTWVNHTARTARDYSPPASITNLKNVTYARTYIKWTWKDPSTYDFTKVMIYLNGVFKGNITKGKQYYNAIGLKNNTYYRISTHTVDTSGNINKTWVNHTSRTAK